MLKYNSTIPHHEVFRQKFWNNVIIDLPEFLSAGKPIKYITMDRYGRVQAHSIVPTYDSVWGEWDSYDDLVIGIVTDEDGGKVFYKNADTLIMEV